MVQIIQGLTASDFSAFNEQQQQAIIKLYKIVKHLTSLAQETGVISSAFNTEFDRIVESNPVEDPLAK